MYDSDYNGLADDEPKPIRCKCNDVAEKHVAFEGCWSGRRFLACSGQVCDVIELMLLSFFVLDQHWGSCCFHLC